MKRTFDIICSLMLLLILLPLLIVIAVSVMLTIGRPICFKQVRPGIKGVTFTLLKFRTMSEAVDSNGKPLPDKDRITSFGAFLRSSSLDELPELWNVLVGDMSLVGPRPLLMEYLPLYTAEQSRRHEIRPGITGWAQVNGRNAISWEERFKLDVWYVDHQSFWLDIKILFMTVVKVIRREGISGADEVTMSKFTGTALGNTRELDD